MNIGDTIKFRYDHWDYKQGKNISVVRTGIVAEYIPYDDINWGTFNVHVYVDDNYLCDNNGMIWTSTHDIVKD